MKTKEERIKEWIAFLRNNPNKQGRSVLESKTGKMCCLGALCFLNQDLVSRKPGDSECMFYTDKGKPSAEEYVSILPPGIVNFFRFKSDIGKLHEHEYSSLAGANDNSIPWSEIADMIEQHPEKVFND